jgi:hypothetical protein
VRGISEDPSMGVYSKKGGGEVRGTRDMNMAARCGGYAVRQMAWAMLLHWDGCGRNPNNAMPTLERSRVEA